MINESDITSSSLPRHWPLLALSGGNERQRDELAAKILPKFHERSIKVLVVKTDEEKVSSYRAAMTDFGNDDVLLLGTDYSHGLKRISNSPGLQEILAPYVPFYDVIILLTDNVSSIDTIQVLDETEQNTNESLGTGESANPVYIHRLGDDSSKLVSFLLSWLQEKVYSIPVWACVLIGGQSSRMGRPKHLITGEDGRTWLETTVERLEEAADQVVLSGKGDIPESLAHLPRMVDIVDVKGPLTGVLSAMRWNPLVSWLLAACDMPDIKRQGLSWLLSMRKPGVWGTVPCQQQNGYSEPLLAHYDFRSAHLLEKLLSRGCLRINQICKESKISTPSIPSELKNCWRNCNSPDDL
jgi:molybdopterin-guanine dinucleotide biosynthesis protein A